MSYQAFKFFNRNNKGRDFVVGDIHGHFTALEKLLWQAKFNAEHDRVFSVGDMIDRGPESHRAIEFLNHSWFHAIRGNHEQMLLDAAHSLPVSRNWITFNGGDWWRDIPDHLQPRIRTIIKQLPLAMEISTPKGRVGIVHADIPTGLPWKDFISLLNIDEEVQDQALWSRSRFKQIQLMGRTQPVSGIDMLIFGHTPVSKPIHEGNIVYIDTGAPYTNDKSLGTLTMLEIAPSVKVHQIKTDTSQDYLALRKRKSQVKKASKTSVPA